MEAAKNTIKKAVGSTSQFATGHQIPIQHQDKPGSQAEMSEQPTSTHIPSNDNSDSDGGYQLYKAAGKLQGKRALITGGDSGIGRAIALLYAMEGAESMIVFLPTEERDARETERLVHERGGTVHLFAADLRAAKNCREVVDVAMRTMGGVDILVNNAGTQTMKSSIEDISEEQWEQTFQTNLHPFFYLSKYTLPHMKRGDTIINCSSINAYIGRPDLLDYTSSKGAIISFTRGLSNMVISRGIRVNAVCPGPVLTPLIVATMDKEAQDQFHSVPMGRPAQPSEIATCFVFLASQDSSFIAGQSLHPNGGVIVNG